MEYSEVTEDFGILSFVYVAFFLICLILSISMVVQEERDKKNFDQKVSECIVKNIDKPRVTIWCDAVVKIGEFK